MKKTKEKKIIAPNECSLFRWIAVLLVGTVVAIIFASPFEALTHNTTDRFMGVTYADIFKLVMFIPFFVGIAFAIKVIGKTSIKDFIFGVGKKMNWKTSLIVFGLYFVGFVASQLITWQNMSLRDVEPSHFAFLVLFTLLTVWMQTTYEEFIYRGIVLRWVCKNDIGYSKKSIIASILSSLVFMAIHLMNPEVTSQTGINVIIVACAYFFSGLFLFWVDVHFKSLMPGIVIHWLNNFLLMAIISQEASVIAAPTLIIDKTPRTAVLDLVFVFITYLPVIIFIIRDLIKRKKNAAANKQ